MIIFDDIEFTKLMVKGKVPKNIYQNTTFRSLARARFTLNLSESDIEKIIVENTNFQISKIDWYYEEFLDKKPVEPHAVTFSRADVLRVNKLKTVRDKKIYLAIMFLSKYYNAKRIKLSLLEIKAIMNMKNHNGLNYKTVVMGEGVTLRREKDGVKMQHSDIKNHKGFFYYYPPNDEKFSDKISFKYKYKGSPYYLPSIEFQSNLSDLWELYLKASEKDREKEKRRRSKIQSIHNKRCQIRYPEEEKFRYVEIRKPVFNLLSNVLTINEYDYLKKFLVYIDRLDGTVKLPKNDFISFADIESITNLNHADTKKLIKKLVDKGIFYRQKINLQNEETGTIMEVHFVIYMNPYIFWVEQYIDIQAAEIFKETVWHKINDKSSGIDKWIADYCC